MTSTHIPIFREDDGELLGFIGKDHASWKAMTIFGYVLARVEDEASAESIVRSDGQSSLKGMWQYKDSDGEWYPCILKQAYENRVVVVRTNELGFEDQNQYKLVTLKHPTDDVLLKA